MIEFDYIIERDMGNGEIETFTPDKLPTKLPNLVYIEGPNSSGKSTLLHILALSMYGHKNKKINPALRNKMDALLDAQHQKLTFETKITNKDESLKIISRKKGKDSPEIVLFEGKNGEGEKPLSFESFENKYNLIYDIPDKPTERLNQLTIEIKEEQQRYGNKVRDLEVYIRNIITKISESRDQKRIDDLKTKLKQIEKEKKQLEKDKIHSQKILEILKKYMCCRYLDEYLDKEQALSEEIKILESKRASRTQVSRRFTTQYTNSKNEINKSLDKMDTQFRTATTLLNSLLPAKERHHLSVWKRINLNGAINDYVFDENLEREIIHFINVLSEMKTREESNESLKEAMIISDLIKFLSEYENSEIILPGVEISLVEFIKALKGKNKKNQELIERLNNLDSAKKLLTELDGSRQTIEKELSRLKMLAEKEEEHSDTTSEMDNIEKELSKLQNRKKSIDTKLDIYVASMDEYPDVDDQNLKMKIRELEKNKELTPYFRYNEDQLAEKIHELEKSLKSLNEDIVTKEFYIRDYERDIRRLEEKEPHKYQPYVNELNQLFQKTGHISQKLLKEYNENISVLIKNDLKNQRLKDDKNKKYFYEVSKYLARRIGTFHHIDKDYKAVTVDLISGKISTEDGKIIQLIDMGTGQSQSTYLLGLLNTKDDNRKIIALFDEVAMMDSTSLEPIYQKFRELYETDRLLAGIVVQKADEVSIIPI